MRDDDYHSDDDIIDASDDRDRYSVNRLTALQTISIDNYANKDSQCRARDAELL